MAAVEPHRVAAPSRQAGQLYERNYARVFAYCLWRLRSREDAEDAAQTTFLNALASLSRGSRPEAECAWLLTIAQNVCRARWRSQQSRPTELPHSPEALATIAAPETDPQLLHRLQGALAQLPDQQRRSFILRECQGLSYAEIATELGTSEPAVASLVFRARHALIDALADERPRRRGVGGSMPSALAWLKSLFAGSAAKLTAAGVGVVLATAVATPVAFQTRQTPRRPPTPQTPAAADRKTPTRVRSNYRPPVRAQATRPNRAHSPRNAERHAARKRETGSTASAPAPSVPSAPTQPENSAVAPPPPPAAPAANAPDPVKTVSETAPQLPLPSTLSVPPLAQVPQVPQVPSLPATPPLPKPNVPAVLP